ncbi:7556_t:CDS:10 [Funneliformis mosseae]|uniref:7556_t:CDS:1 n=1 Tax=Funneliformis mosseae TaxID=27381 RepID=A0A9N8ZTG2_FUNMO|nr:7556_t:CDS:10 [Funneliformis mosseae]
MSYIKASLKSAREALEAKNWEFAVTNCENVLKFENDNYMAHVFLGLAKLNLNRISESEQAYLRAIEINRSNLLAWQGLTKFYESQEKWSELAETLQEILNLHKASKDANKMIDTINKLIDLYTKRKDRKALVSILEFLLPGSPYYDSIKKLVDVPTPVQTLSRIIELLDKEENETINREIETRRKRLGAGSPAEIKSKVYQEVYTSSKLEEFYDKLFELIDDSNASRVDITKLSQNYIEHLQKKIAIISLNDKHRIREKLYEKSQRLIDRGYDSPMPYEIIIESTDASSADEYDSTLLKQYSENFPHSGLSKIIQGFEMAENSLFGHLTLSWIYYESKDYELALETAKNGRDVVQKYNKEFGSTLDRLIQSLQLCMANCYLNIDVKYYTDALSLYQKLLKADKNNIPALQGVGMVLSAQKQYDKAIEIFEKIQKLDSSNHISISEIGWIEFLQENYEEAAKLTLKAIEMSNENALYFYRLGRIYWGMGDEHRNDKNRAYAQFVRSAKLDPRFASSFTYLGHYYRLIEKDHVRAKKCYQKSFSTDPREEEAGFQLSEYYQSDREFQNAEDLYRTTVQVNYKAGWAWKRLGFSELENGNYLEAITDFQTALRTDSKDIHCWEGLAESYRREGRYTASMKAFLRAIELDPSSVFANYKAATVKQKLGMYAEAIDQYNLTLEKAQIKGEENHMLSLKGLGDCYLALTKEYFQGGYYGRAAESLGHGLSTILRAIRVNNKVQCLWKLVGDLCIAAPSLPNYLDLVPVEIIVNLVEIARKVDLDFKLHLPKDIDNLGIRLITDTDFSNLRGADLLIILLTCGCLAYKYAILLSGNRSDTASALWYDLGLIYYNVYQCISGDGNEVDMSNLLSIAIRSVKIALKFEPTNSNFWNALGVMTLIDDAKISQNAFIKAINYSPMNATPWTNLGILYLLHSDLELANQAFSKAHSLDPDYVPGWVGQAYVANLWGSSSEAVELFEHSYEISGGGYVLEADYGFASQAFIQYKNSSKLHRSSLISPTFALLKLTEQRPDDAAAMNLLGIFYEWLNQPDKAAEAFSNATLALERLIQREQQRQGLADEDQVSNIPNYLINKLAYVQGNLGRVLCANHDFSGSISAYNRTLSLIEQGNLTSAATFKIYTILGVGLSYYFNNQLEDSLQMFEIALNETDDAEQIGGGIGINEVRKDVVVLLSQVLWALGGVDHKKLAKEELFRCIAQNPNHLPAIFGLCAMGLLQDDETLASATLNEMIKLPIKVIDNLDRERDVDFLLSRYFLLRNSPEEATNTLTKSVHLKPFELIGWSRLANHLTSIASPFTSVSIASTALALISNPLSNASKNLGTMTKAKLYQTFVTALLITRQHLSNEISDEEESIKVEKIKLCEKLRLEALRAIQTAIKIAPWDLVGWSLLGIACGK